MKPNGTFADKRAKKIVEQVEDIVVSQHFHTDGESRYHKDLINLTGVVNLMSQQLTALCEAIVLTVAPRPGVEQPPSLSQQLHTQLLQLKQQLLMPLLTLLHPRIPTAASTI
ncbi:unnamed protein product [Microthlaspi erraticum]|uniref:Uncharacterized protein n=1 Tax=Microthlaspi erraticum TaxID=1685480 RepID=A0A6D2I2T6_9BRAS|nr:unnamed protein product [Microthlaspi erraticum]CAA7022319.1 unnamed protein product [Microthlaspi erraticum]